MIIDWNKVEQMGTTEIDNLRIEILKEIQTIKDGKFLVREEYDAVSKQIRVLEDKKADLRSAMGKAQYNIDQRETDIERLKAKYWEKRV